MFERLKPPSGPYDWWALDYIQDITNSAYSVSLAGRYTFPSKYDLPSAVQFTEHGFTELEDALLGVRQYSPSRASYSRLYV